MFVFGNHSYIKSRKILIAFNYNEITMCLQYMQKHIRSKKKGYFVGYMTYECALLIQANQFKDSSLYHKKETFENNKEPLLYFEFFKDRKKFKPKKEKFINDKILFDVYKNIDEIKYKNDFSEIKKNILHGNTYQTNYTQEVLLIPKLSINEFAYFNKILHKQNTKYRAYIKNDFLHILSFSPELFFRLKNNKITTKPMKGTINRGFTDLKSKHFGTNKNTDIESIDDIYLYKMYKKNKIQKNIDRIKDFKNVKTLHYDIKNRSENVMIVDLLRNDLSKIALQGSVKVKDIFAIQTYPTLHQMTSTITAKLPKNCTLLEILQAIFPCGSITGAPKLKTIEIINMLEQRKRGVYCGAIGVISKKESIFNIPIRTLHKSKCDKYYRYGVGSGIVWDSDVHDELKELQLKSNFLIAQTNTPKNIHNG